ncbi:hypothetical protein [Nostoc sp. 'Lobaria pulmonaria (5183) cyanobiont']|uniref:hypothetical protein n=1 Tax=Nostoc sp. 'Lobaria pulmonaria (5183) cyanobiont' TaxID=1618022 RepID=UPI000CF35C5E|nr:hypothetical protein [Nostoc sp. 'Lobaria pulmonaria (5183) cyanobiont']
MHELLLWKEKSERHKQATAQNFASRLSEMYGDRSHQNPLIFSVKKLLRDRRPILDKQKVDKPITSTE